ncbi:MAG: XRE family transcriptional regulator [Candidatus Sericytochromatia bacterium]|nr:XRE family transcriptional regulator [Candidatus Sericytochromatia bacterium]
MAKPYQRLRDKVFTPEQQAEHAAEARRLLDELPLAQLRQALDFTQAQLAALLDVSQPAVTQMEKQTDMLIGTLRTYLEAMGGELEVRARFPQGDVVITQFMRVEGGTSGVEGAADAATTRKRVPRSRAAG